MYKLHVHSSGHADSRIENSTDIPRKRANTFMKPEGSGRKKRKVCKGCYNERRQTTKQKSREKSALCYKFLP